jgi:hypothetical protein
MISPSSVQVTKKFRNNSKVLGCMRMQIWLVCGAPRWNRLRRSQAVRLIARVQRMAEFEKIDLAAPSNGR